MKQIAFILLLVALLGTTACTKKRGPAERAGEAIDRAASDAADTIEDAGDKLEDSVERSKK